MYTTKTDFSCQYEYLRKIKKDLEVVFLGSSHMAKAVNPEFITKKSFNLAYSAQDLYGDYMIIKRLIDEMPHLETLVIEMTLYSYGSENYTGYLLKEYFWELGIMPKMRFVPHVIANSSVFYCHQDTFIEDVFKGKKPVPYFIVDIDSVEVSLLKNQCLLSNGYRFSYGSMPKEKLFSHAKKRARKHSLTGGIERIIAENESYLEKIIDLIESRKLKMIMVTTPTTNYYQENFDAEFVASFRNKIKYILEAHPSITYYDFSNMEGLEASDFLNSDHLNYQGSKKFSLLLDSLFNKKSKI
jgi:hypothetical protein